jgi:hypothetical protein
VIFSITIILSSQTTASTEYRWYALNGEAAQLQRAAFTASRAGHTIEHALYCEAETIQNNQGPSTR